MSSFLFLDVEMFANFSTNLLRRWCGSTETPGRCDYRINSINRRANESVWSRYLPTYLRRAFQVVWRKTDFPSGVDGLMSETTRRCNKHADDRVWKFRQSSSSSAEWSGHIWWEDLSEAFPHGVGSGGVCELSSFIMSRSFVWSIRGWLHWLGLAHNWNKINHHVARNVVVSFCWTACTDT